MEIYLIEQLIYLGLIEGFNQVLEFYKWVEFCWLYLGLQQEYHSIYFYAKNNKQYIEKLTNVNRCG